MQECNTISVNTNLRPLHVLVCFFLSFFPHVIYFFAPYFFFSFVLFKLIFSPSFFLRPSFFLFSFVLSLTFPFPICLYSFLNCPLFCFPPVFISYTSLYFFIFHLLCVLSFLCSSLSFVFWFPSCVCAFVCMCVWYPVMECIHCFQDKQSSGSPVTLTGIKWLLKMNEINEGPQRNFAAWIIFGIVSSFANTKRTNENFRVIMRFVHREMINLGTDF